MRKEVIVRCLGHENCFASKNKTDINPCYHSGSHVRTIKCGRPRENTKMSECECYEMSEEEMVLARMTGK